MVFAGRRLATRYGGVPQRDAEDVIRERGGGEYLGESRDDIRLRYAPRVKATPQGFVDGKGEVRGTEPTITALWAAVNVLQQDMAELQREIFQEEDGE